MTRNISRRGFILAVCDMFAVAAALFIAVALRTDLNLEGGQFSRLLFSQTSFFILLLFPLVFYIFDLYFPFKYFSPGQTFIDVVLSVSVGMVIASAIAYLDRTFAMPRFMFVYATLLLIPLIFGIRLAYDFIFRSRVLDKRTLILGTGPAAYEIARVIKQTPNTSIEIVGMVSEKKRDQESEPKGDIPVLGDLSSLVSLIDWYRVELIVLALDPNEEASETQVLADLLQFKLMVTSSIHLFERLTGEVPYQLLGGHYLVGLMAQVRARPYLKIKRILDIVFGSLLLVLLSPLFLLGVILLFFSGPKRIFFVQERAGADGKPFKLIKLRTMADSKDGQKVITGIGKWLRKYRIDEMPQLINVLKGDMSLIGPRPEIPYFVNRCREKIPFYDMVFTLKPGITGWAQVKFRYTTSVKDYEHKFRYNLYYIKNISLALDLLVILKTVRVVLMGKGS